MAWDRHLGGRIALAGVAMALGLACDAVRAADSPNIIFILADDQGIDAIQGANWPNDLGVHTPSIAGFASQGRSFAYCRSNSKCSPTRAGLLTGRSALRTGVNGVIKGQDAERDRLSLQGHEHTIAELLQGAGYWTILLDKWHVGVGPGQSPEDQGFNVFHNYNRYLHHDDPIEVGDEHVTRMTNIGLREVAERPDPEQPFALFYWCLDPHARHDRSGREPKGWWKVTEELLPSGEDYYNPEHDNNRNRYRAVVESLDTELGRMLRTLGVVDDAGEYMPESNTIVFYLADNGTPTAVLGGSDHSKGSVYEAGVRVPCWVFGAGVPTDGLISDRLVGHVDLYDTIADVVGMPLEERGAHPRDGFSFADAIGYPGPGISRTYTLSSAGDPKPTRQYVGLADRRYKLITRAGSIGLAPSEGDLFFDLLTDPGELDNLRDQLTSEQRRIYQRMRGALGDYWNATVAEPFRHHVELPLTDALTLTDAGDAVPDLVGVGHVDPGASGALEARGYLRFDVAALDDLLPDGKTIDDVTAAEIVLFFGRDSEAPDDSDTGLIVAHPMLLDWFTEIPEWAAVWDEFGPTYLGNVDLPPYIVADPAGSSLTGVPLADGSPCTLTTSSGLLDTVRAWHADPASNLGLVLVATPLPEIGGNQTVRFQADAMLRLTVE